MTMQPGTLTIWNAAHDSVQWIEFWKTWKEREVFAHPTYLSLLAREKDEVLCAAMRTAGGGILYPFVLRPLSAEPWAEGEKSFDLIGPYLYGGPFAWSASNDDAALFFQQFESWAKKKNVVSSYEQRHLFEARLLPEHGTIQHIATNLVKQLDGDREKLLKSYASNVRRNVQAAQRNGVRVVLDETGEKLDDFLAIYTATMQRVSARAFFYFPKTFFESLIKAMPGQCMLFHAMDGSRIVSTEMVFVTTEWGYFFAGGTLEEAFSLRPNELLKHEIMATLGERGVKTYGLGGYPPGPEGAGLLRYKMGFTPAEHAYKSCTHIFDSDAYEHLMRLRRTDELKKGITWTAREGYFPAYRG